MVLTRRQTQEREGAAAEGAVANHHGLPKTLQHQAMEVAEAEKKVLNGQPRSPPTTPKWVYVLLIAFAILTFVTIPKPFHPPPGVAPSIEHVFFYGWLTAMSTGLGALPFLLFPDVATFWVGISNGTFGRSW